MIVGNIHHLQLGCRKNFAKQLSIKSHVSDETAKVSTLLTATACFI